jgi:hypothetical protein
MWARTLAAQRDRLGEVHRMSVAEFLARHLRNRPRRATDRDVGPRQLKDRVSRALTGTGLSRDTLALFIEAFGIDAEETEKLWRQWEGLEPPRVIIGSLPPFVDPGVPPPSYRTVQLHELHEIGESGRPVSHRTVQEIEALVDGVDRHRYSFDNSRVRSVEPVAGGRPDGPPYRLNEDVSAVDLRLPQPLNRFESATLVYETTFAGEGWIEPVLRRAVHRRITNVVFRVAFHPGRLPRQVWWAEWADYREGLDRIISRTPVALDAENAVHRRVEAMERAVAGFLWEFD